MNHRWKVGLIIDGKHWVTLRQIEAMGIPQPAAMADDPGANDIF